MNTVKVCMGLAIIKVCMSVKRSAQKINMPESTQPFVHKEGPSARESTEQPFAGHHYLERSVNEGVHPKPHQETQPLMRDNNQQHGFQKSHCPWVINYCIAVLLVLIIGVLLAQTSLNCALVAIHSLDSEGDTSFMLQPVNSTYILTIPGHKDRVEFSFVNQDAKKYTVTFDVSTPESQELEVQSRVNISLKCSNSISEFNKAENCYIIRYWPSKYSDQYGDMSCDEGVKVYWKWFSFSLVQKNNDIYNTLNIECPSNLSAYQNCSEFTVEEVINNRTQSDQIVVIRLCTSGNLKEPINVYGSYFESYSQLTNTIGTYIMGGDSNNDIVTIPLTGDEKCIQINTSTVNTQTMIPAEIKIKYIDHDGDNRLLMVSMYVGAIGSSMNIMAILVVLSCVCCKLSK